MIGSSAADSHMKAAWIIVQYLKLPDFSSLYLFISLIFILYYFKCVVTRKFEGRELTESGYCININLFYRLLPDHYHINRMLYDVI